jgi:hypothetical protein
LKNLLFGLVLLTTSFHAFGQLSAPKYVNDFLQIGVGARALGMSNAAVVGTDDVTAAYWNPSSLIDMKADMQGGLMHGEYFAGIAKYDYAGFAWRLDTQSVAAVSVIRFGVDDIMNTIDLVDQNNNVNYDRITYFSAADYAILLSYARKTAVPGLRLGGNVKLIYRRIGDFSNAFGFGIDASARYDVGNWQFGAVVRDVTGTFTAWSYSLDERTIEVFELTGNEIPENSVEVALPRVVGGVSRIFPIGDKYSVRPEFNAVFTTDGKRNNLLNLGRMSIDPMLGIEGRYSNFLFVRAGIGNYQSFTNGAGEKEFTIQPNIGLGLRIRKLYLDYALANLGDSETFYSNIFSLRFNIRD